MDALRVSSTLSVFDIFINAHERNRLVASTVYPQGFLLSITNEFWRDAYTVSLCLIHPLDTADAAWSMRGPLKETLVAILGRVSQRTRGVAMVWGNRRVAFLIDEKVAAYGPDFFSPLEEWILLVRKLVAKNLMHMRPRTYRALRTVVSFDLRKGKGVARVSCVTCSPDSQRSCNISKSAMTLPRALEHLWDAISVPTVSS